MADLFKRFSRYRRYSVDGIQVWMRLISLTEGAAPFDKAYVALHISVELHMYVELCVSPLLYMQYMTP
jgi:hypothetical protein